ncbi:hypothetical protein GCM10008949_28070 [Deinococcus humi]|nr:hypothetical protein GCM10008949_28070 [Deinococcus humi]
MALGTLSGALAAPAPGLKGATLCLSPTITVTLGNDTDIRLAGLADRLYAEARALLRAGGVKYSEEQVCRQASAELTLSVSVVPGGGGLGSETRVSARVDDESADGPNTWLSSSVLRWSAVKYGSARLREPEVTARLSGDTRTLLGQLVNDWKAANR